MLIALLAGTGCRYGPDLPAEAHPVIILDIDTLRADELGCYGYGRATSPTIDRIASEGTRFEWAFAQAPVTAPSQASILTSLYPTVHGLLEYGDKLPGEVTTLAEVLRAEGFTTAAFVDGGFMSRQWGVSQGFGLYDQTPTESLRVIGPKVQRWVEAHSRETFFLLVHTYDVHTPYAPAEPYRSMFLDGLSEPSDGFEPTADRMKAQLFGRRNGSLEPLPQRDIEYARALYDAEIRFVDDWIGRFMAQLKRLGLLERATLIVLSDHGEEFQEHGSVMHEKLYATVTRIPLIFRPPGGGEGRVVSDVVEAIDVMPTVIDLVGAALPETALHLLQQLPRPLRLAIEQSEVDPVVEAGERLQLGEPRHLAGLLEVLHGPLRGRPPDLGEDRARDAPS
jgi:arylsulfatase A-like enzyme